MTYRIKQDEMSHAVACLDREMRGILTRIATPKSRLDQQWATAELAVILARRTRKHQRDKAGDAMRRTLVGARLPREVARQVKAQAQAEGMSMYRWVERAITVALAKGARAIERAP